MTTPEPQPPMTDREADYLLAAAMGLAQAARLIPVDALAEHYVRRFQEACQRAAGPERGRAVAELAFASALSSLVHGAESLAAARVAEQRAEVEQAKAEVQAAADAPPSRRPPADDDVWATDAPGRAR